MNWITKLGLKKEAILLDSKWYIVKTFLAISTAFVLMSQVELVHRDMISVLFGLVLTLEPVNRVGIKNGWDQIFASLIGAVTTSAIILIFGVNPLSIGASVALTLYICLLINWKSVSPVALFTAIYMTQFLQLGPDGNPSVWITLQLRFAALCSGIAVAVFYNYVFSLIQYKGIGRKRSVYLMKQVLINLEQLKVAFESGDRAAFKQIRLGLIETSNTIEWTYGLFTNMSKEAGGRFLTNVQKQDVETAIYVTNHVRNVSHMLFDLAFVVGEDRLEEPALTAIRPAMAQAIHQTMDQLGALKRQYETGTKVAEVRLLNLNLEPAWSGAQLRLMADMASINQSVVDMASVLSEKNA